MIKVYIAGPYTNGDVAVNVRNAIEVGQKLLSLGYAPFIPHLTHFWHIIFPNNYRKWLEVDAEFLLCCDYVIRLPGLSSGADEECQLAALHNIPVVTLEFFYNETPKDGY